MAEEELVEKREGDVAPAGREEKKEEAPSPESELAELRDKYVRLYAEFENYKKRVQRDKEELIRYCNESILHEILPVIDTLEMALSHSDNSSPESLIKGVERTLREFQRVTEKFGLIPIPATGKPFDPSVHHAMSQVERDDVEDKTVVEEFRKGYMFGDKVLRPSLVAVSKKPSAEAVPETEINKESEEE